MIDESSKTKEDGHRANGDRPVYQVDAQYETKSSSLTQPRPGKRGWAAAEGAVAAREELPAGKGLSNGDAMSMHRSTNTTYQQRPPSGEGFGIDTVALVLDVRPDSIGLGTDPWKSTRSTNHKLGTTSTSVATFTVNGVSVRADFYLEDHRVRLEFNAARMLLDQPKLLPPDALAPLVKAVLPELVEHIVPTFMSVDFMTGKISFDQDWQAQVGTRRIDIARNLDSINTRPLMAAFQARPPSGQLRRQINSGKSWSVVHRSIKDGDDTFYFKPGPWGEIFRFETRIRGRRRDRYGLATLADISAGSCWFALESRWNALGHGEAFRVAGEAGDALARLKPRERTSVLGYLAAIEAGVDTGMSKSTAGRLRKLAASVGLTPGIALSEQGGELRRLDLYQGREVPVVLD